jgi:AcrR family transcriptional regulator
VQNEQYRIRLILTAYADELVDAACWHKRRLLDSPGVPNLQSLSVLVLAILPIGKEPHDGNPYKAQEYYAHLPYPHWHCLRNWLHYILTGTYYSVGYGSLSSIPTPMTKKALSAKRALTLQRLIDAAREAISEKGFHRTTLDEIAARAGLTKGAIYDNFESKDDLFLAVVLTNARDRLERFPWPRSRRGTLRTRMRRLAVAVIADAPAWKLEAPLRAEFLLYTLTHEQLRARLAGLYTDRVDAVRERLRQSIQEEELPIPADKFVLLLEALIPGLMYVRAQAPELMTDETIIQIFESLT